MARVPRSGSEERTARLVGEREPGSLGERELGHIGFGGQGLGWRMAGVAGMGTGRGSVAADQCFPLAPERIGCHQK